jgi:hypothetical protein
MWWGFGTFLPLPRSTKGKRPRLFTSSELTSLPKRAGVTTRRRARIVEAVEAVAQLGEDDDEGEGDDEGEEGELPSLEELVKQE